MPRKSGPIRPENPTGRLVLPPEGAKKVEIQVSHWCPKDGITWSCPTCGQEFRRSEDLPCIPWREVS